MIKIFLIICIIPWQLWAWDKESTVKIYHHLFHAISKKEVIKIYTRDKEYRDAFDTSKRMQVVHSPDKADVILICSDKGIEKLMNTSKSNDVNFFTTSYKLLKQYPKIIGAFYWKKGRSQLLFVKGRLEKRNIRLPQEYQKFVVESL